MTTTLREFWDRLQLCERDNLRRAANEGTAGVAKQGPSVIFSSVLDSVEGFWQGRTDFAEQVCRGWEIEGHESVKLDRLHLCDLVGNWWLRLHVCLNNMFAFQIFSATHFAVDYLFIIY